MPRPGKQFYAKIMLFGEYSLLHGSGALTMPFRKHWARLLFPFPGMSEKQQRVALRSNDQLHAFRDFLKQDDACPPISRLMDLDRFGEELAQGIFLQSNIPSGYGLGSSGALVAALYDRYAKPRSMPGEGQPSRELAWLQALFSRMESCFHGSSSGIDPLSIYAGQPLLIKGEHDLSRTRLGEGATSASGGFFLVNTHIPRKTSDLVAIFREKLADAGFRRRFMEEYIPCNDACIEAVTNTSHTPAETGLFFEAKMHALSSLQWVLFREMIPEIFRPMWQEGLSSGDYLMKLCGAGGGGFLLGHTNDFGRASGLWKKHHANVITPDGQTLHRP